MQCPCKQPRRRDNKMNLRTVLLTASLCCFPLAAQAGLLGQTATCSITDSIMAENLSCDAGSAVVGAGTEFTVLTSEDPGGAFIQNLWTIDIDDDGIAIINLFPGFGSFSLGPLVLGNLVWSGGGMSTIVGIDNFSSDIAGVEASDVFVASASSININMNGAELCCDSMSAGAGISFDLVVEQRNSGVPVPGSLPLLLLGVSVLTILSRRVSGFSP